MSCPSCPAQLAGGARFCGACGTAFVTTETQASDSLPALRAPDLAGREIAGRYRIVAKLGEGGMGAVFRAEQISLKRAVALKVLRSELSSTPHRHSAALPTEGQPPPSFNDTLLRRFNAEAQLVAKLSHPNTVNIYDFGQDSDGSLFIAMELIEGRSLRAVLRESGPLPPARALAIAAQLAASLADAHAHGIIHRDLKPDNAMLQDRGKERDVVRVLDFGIAKLRDDARGDQPTMTQAGDLVGTPQYMAPEQIRGEAIDGRTDIYALGCILYEMLTGRMPFEAPTVMALLAKHLTEDVVPPSQRRPDLGLSPALDALVMSALHKAAAARPPTMEAYGEQLAAVLGTYAPATPPPPSQPYTAQRVAQPSQQYAAPVAAAPTPFTPLAMQLAPRQPAASSHLAIVLALVGAALAVVVGVGIGVYRAKHADRAPAAPPGPAFGISEAAPTLDIPNPDAAWADAGQTDALPVPRGASLRMEPGARAVADVPGIHNYDAQRNVSYYMLPLIPGTNDAGKLIADYLGQHPHLRLVGVGALTSNGGPHTYASFVGRDGPVDEPAGEVAAVYLGTTYRVGVVVVAPPALFSDPAFGDELTDFFAHGVHLP